MLAITQYEVYMLQQGRWILHARYPSEERKEAIQDARRTEAATNFPSKVVRETYFPEVNESETITAYISPRAKEQQNQSAQRRTPLGAARAAADVLTRRGRSGYARPHLTTAQIFFRVIVAGGISLAAATMMTGVVAWMLYRFADAGMDISANARSTILTYAYVLMFLLVFWRLFRSRLPLHRLLADLWQKASAQSQAAAMPTTLSGKPPKVKPKHSRPPSPETLREWEDLKVKRGDLDTAKPPEIAPEIANAPPAVAVAPVAEAVPPPQMKVPEKPAAPPTPEPVAPPPVLDAEKSTDAKKKEKAAEDARIEKAALEKAQQEKALQEAQKAEAPQNINLERMVLRRFAADVVKPAIKSSMPDDPVARRGAAVVLAGAAAGVAATAHLNAALELELLTDALRHIGMNQAAVDSFLHQHSMLIASPANANLLAAGRNALAAYLEGAIDIAASLGRALAGWRTPFGQPAALPGANPAYAAADALPLIDVYVLTELRENARPGDDEKSADAFHDQAMGTHNGVVRNAIAAHGGHEIKHTGKGIFARFGNAVMAVDAATDMQRQFAEDGSKLAIAIIGNTVASEDPILSAGLVRQAQAILTRTAAGEILCETQVRAAVQRQRSTETGFENQTTEDLDLVRLVLPEPGFESQPSAPQAKIRLG